MSSSGGAGSAVPKDFKEIAIAILPEEELINKSSITLLLKHSLASIHFLCVCVPLHSFFLLVIKLNLVEDCDFD